MNIQMKREQGITLIALVVTIVVLLILAAVSISMLTGENGIITQAQKSREETIIADEKEILSLSYSSCKQENMFEGLVTEEQLQIELDNNKRDTVVTLDGNDLEIVFNDTKHKYVIYQDGTIEQVENLSPEEANKIVDVVANCRSGIYVLTAEGKVKKANIIDGNIFYKLEIIEDNETITRDGIREKGNNYFIDNKGKVYTWGSLTGNGTDNDGNEPICISDISGNALNGKDIVKMYRDQYNYDPEVSIAIDSQGKVYTWGVNYCGQLGDGTNVEYSNKPQCISDIQENELNGKRIIDIVCDRETVIALDDQGKIYTWGNNYYGQLGNGTNVEYSNEPQCISDIQTNCLNGKVITNMHFDIDGRRIIVLDNQGKVYTWGDNQWGQLGDGTWDDSGLPICISEITNSELSGRKIVRVLTSGFNTIALDNQGKLYEWGSSTDYNKPICISEDVNELNGKNITDIYTFGGSDGYSSIAKDDQGKIYTWGVNYDGVQGNGTDYGSEPICISDISENALNGKNIIHIYLDVEFPTAIALDDQGKVYTWGNNYRGQLGDGTSIDSNEPICISDIPDSEINGMKIKNYGKIIDMYYYISEDDNVYILPFKYY